MNKDSRVLSDESNQSDGPSGEPASTDSAASDTSTTSARNEVAALERTIDTLGRIGSERESGWQRLFGKFLRRISQLERRIVKRDGRLSEQQQSINMLRTLSIAAAVVAVTLSSVASAQTNNVERMLTAFRDWTERYGVADASIAVTVDGVVVGTDAIGDYAADLPVPVASESKAISGLCVARLVDDGRLDFDSTLGALLPTFFGANAFDERAAGITLGELLKHTSGIVSDPTQGASLAQFRPYSETASAAILGAALSTPLGADPGTRYAYNNANYAALQWVIEETTQQDYETACRELVLDPVGVTDADLNPDWRVMGGYGGWRISVTDFARVLRYYLPDNDLLSIPVDEWPSVDLGGGASYRLGVLVREAGSGHNFWHQGAWTRSDPPTSFGAFFALWQTVGIVVAYAPNASDNAVAALDRALYNAAHP